MRFSLSTLVDITETNKRKEDGVKLYSQQSNFNTVIQTIGLRVNLIPVSNKAKVENVKMFGDNYKGKHRYWQFIFDVEYEGALNIEMLESDFNLIPVIVDLDETAHNHNKIFRTKCSKDCNIVFEILEE